LTIAVVDRSMPQKEGGVSSLFFGVEQAADVEQEFGRDEGFGNEGNSSHAVALNIGAGGAVAAHEERFEFRLAETEQRHEVDPTGAGEADVRDDEIDFRMSVPDAIRFDTVRGQKKFVAKLFENEREEFADFLFILDN
jgi:hypothetical protein